MRIQFYLYSAKTIKLSQGALQSPMHLACNIEISWIITRHSRMPSSLPVSDFFCLIGTTRRECIMEECVITCCMECF